MASFFIGGVENGWFRGKSIGFRGKGAVTFQKGRNTFQNFAWRNEKGRGTFGNCAGRNRNSAGSFDNFPGGNENSARRNGQWRRIGGGGPRLFSGSELLFFKIFRPRTSPLKRRAVTASRRTAGSPSGEGICCCHNQTFTRRHNDTGWCGGMASVFLAANPLAARRWIN